MLSMPLVDDAAQERFLELTLFLTKNRRKDLAKTLIRILAYDPMLFTSRMEYFEDCRKRGTIGSIETTILGIDSVMRQQRV